MKKFVTAIILVCMTLSMAACGGSSEAEYKLGMGVVVSTDSSSDNNAQVDATVATVVTDANGKIVLCRLDCAQNKMDVTGGAVDTAKTFLTKRELGDDYNMVKYSDATLEWYQQAENFEAYCVGKTADEIAGIETKVNEEGYNVAVDETLYASCSISIEDFIGAVVKACSDEKGQTFKASGELKLGLAAITDSIQPVVNADKEGKIVDSTFKGTKRELGSDYGMVAYGNAIAEWDAQAQAFANYTVGKTADEVRAIETTQNDHGYSVTADETLYASCTMQITGMMAVLAQAADYAR